MVPRHLWHRHRFRGHPRRWGRPPKTEQTYKTRIDTRDTIGCERLGVVAASLLELNPSASVEELADTALTFIPDYYDDDLEFLNALPSREDLASKLPASSGAVPCTCMSARLESPSASKAELRMKSARSLRLRVLAIVKSHAMFSSARCTPASSRRPRMSWSVALSARCQTLLRLLAGDPAPTYEEVGAALTRHPGVRRISFTGSPETAVHIGTAAADAAWPMQIVEMSGRMNCMVS